MKFFLSITAIVLFSLSASAQIKSATLTAGGLTCSMCSKAVYKALQKVQSVQKVEADIDGSAYVITFRPGALMAPADLKKAVERAGFSVVRLTLTAEIPAPLTASQVLQVQGSSYRIINAGTETISGTRTFIVVDKSYLPDSEYNRWATQTAGDNSGSAVYHIIL